METDIYTKLALELAKIRDEHLEKLTKVSNLDEQDAHETMAHVLSKALNEFRLMSK